MTTKPGQRALLALLPAAIAASFFLAADAATFLLGVSASVSTALVSIFSPPLFLLRFDDLGVILDGVAAGDPITEEFRVLRLESIRLSRSRSAPVLLKKT